MADQVLVRGNTTVPLQPPVHRLSTTTNARSASLQYALRELHLGDVKVPSDVGNNSIVPGCVTEFLPPVCQPSYTSRLAPTVTSHHSMTTQHSIDTVCEGETYSHTDHTHNNSNTDNTNNSDHVCNPEPTPARKQRDRRGRRSAVDAMMHMNSRRHTMQGVTPGPAETLFVPANHPLLKQDSSERPPANEGEDFERNIKIQIVEPTVPVCEQTSMSMMTLKQPTDVHAPVPISAVPHKPDLGFKDGRRSSDGVNDPFKHLLHKAENQSYDQYLKEYEELRKLIQGSETPEQMLLQQQHQQFIETTTCMDTAPQCTMSYGHPGTLPPPQYGGRQQAPEQWKSSPLSSQNELMATLQYMKLHEPHHNQELDVSEIDLTWSGPGPCRRPASYRKISGGVSPIPAHIRKRRTAVVDGPSPPVPCDSEDSMDSIY